MPKSHVVVHLRPIRWPVIGQMSPHVNTYNDVSDTCSASWLVRAVLKSSTPSPLVVLLNTLWNIYTALFAMNAEMRGQSIPFIQLGANSFSLLSSGDADYGAKKRVFPVKLPKKQRLSRSVNLHLPRPSVEGASQHTENYYKYLYTYGHMTALPFYIQEAHNLLYGTCHHQAD